MQPPFPQVMKFAQITCVFLNLMGSKEPKSECCQLHVIGYGYSEKGKQLLMHPSSQLWDNTLPMSSSIDVAMQLH